MASRNHSVMRMRDPMDHWLESQGLFRKLIAKDGSCLFRAVSEQVFHSQVLHTKVRLACVSFMQSHKDLFDEVGEVSLGEHIESMQNPWEWGGDLEMRVMSFMYRCDFLVYREIGVPPVEATCNGFQKKILLCQLGNNQYDCVYPKDYVKGAAFCQSLVYHVLYEKVFKMEGIDFAVEKMLHDKAVRLRRDSCMTQCSTCLSVRKQNLKNTNEEMDKMYEERIEDTALENKLSSAWYNNAKEIILQGIIPFPYKVAKALDSEIFRNIEFDVWNEQRKELRWDVCDLLNGGESRELRVGSKCLVRLDSSPGKELHAHIQEMALEKGPVLVYVEELAKKCIVQFETLEPLPSAVSSHSLLRSERRHFWLTEKRHVSNACLQNAMSIANSNKQYGFHTWRHSSTGKNRTNYGRYDRKGNSGSNKDGNQSKNSGNRNKGRGTSEQYVASPVVASQMPRPGCQPGSINQEERYSQVWYANSQRHLNLQSQRPENSVTINDQVTSMLGPQTASGHPMKQSLLTSICSTSTSSSENVSVLAPSPVSPACECPSCVDKADNQQCQMLAPIESERMLWNAQPLCYCGYPLMDWRSGPPGNQPLASYMSSCVSSPVPMFQGPPMFPCPSVPPGTCVLPPDSLPPDQGRTLSQPEIPGYRVYNMGHDYYRPSYYAWRGLSAGQPPEQEVGRSQDEEKQSQPPAHCAIDGPSECPLVARSILPSAAQQESSFTGQSEQDFAPHGDEEKPGYEQGVKYSPPAVHVTVEAAPLTPEGAREELSSFPPTRECFPPRADHEVENILPAPSIGRWVDMVRHIPPPVNGSAVHSPCVPMQSPAVLPFSPPHGGMEAQIYVCTTAGTHPPGHHMIYSSFPPHPVPHPQPHLMPPASLQPRLMYQPVNGVPPLGVAPRQ